MLKTTIQSMLKDAMRAKEAQKLETLRFLLSELKYEEIKLQRELTDDESLAVLQREVKKRKDAIEMFRASGRDQIVTEEESKLAVIQALLPAQMGQEELEKMVDEAISKVGTGKMGDVIKEVMSQAKGRAEGKMVSQLVQKKLTT